MQLAEPHIHLWTRDEYYTMADAGLFDGKRVELIEGQVIEMAAMGTAYATAVASADDTLRHAFGAGWFIRIQSPLNLGQTSEPEPDIAVIRGRVRDFVAAHPTTAGLIVEVADSSLTYDRTVKAALYARAMLGDYWIVNLVDGQLEVYRSPVADPALAAGFRYADSAVYYVGDFISPAARPDVSLAVADLLP